MTLSVYRFTGLLGLLQQTNVPQHLLFRVPWFTRFTQPKLIPMTTQKLIVYRFTSLLGLLQQTTKCQYVKFKVYWFTMFTLLNSCSQS